jgi:Xaa-Pro aminopeptidase
MNRAEEWAHKLSTVRRWLEETGAGAVLVEGQGAFAWLTCGGDSHVSLGQQEGCASVLVARERVFLVAANNEVARVLEEELSPLPLETVTFPWYQPTQARSLVERLAGSGPVVSDLGQLGFAPADPSFPALRFTLLPPEVERYRRVGQDAAEAVETACEEALPGQREREVAARIVQGCADRGILPLVVLVAGDERISRYRHPLPTESAWKSTLLVSLTGRRHGLHASLTRMVSADRPDADLSARMAAVQRVDAALLLSSRPGMSLGEILARGQAQYAAEGHPGEWELHHQGGLTGYGGRERFAIPGDPFALGPGHAVAWNPSITWVKSEDTALVAGDGPELLTRTPRWPRVPVRLPEGTVERPALRVLGEGAG